MALALCLLGWAAPHAPGRASALTPSGFTETLVTKLPNRTFASDFEFAPDGRIFIASQIGSVLVYKNGAVLPHPFVTLDVDRRGERGVECVLLDPNFATNGYVYVYYTSRLPEIHNRISRFTADPANPDVALAGSEFVLMDLETLSDGEFYAHNGGSMNVGADGKLYVTVGDNEVSTNSQSLSTVKGKILRINLDGTIPGDNPFYSSSTGNNRAIWALGLRNPYKSSVQPGTGRYFIHDVGFASFEEINDGIAGSNYGWPVCEGNCSSPNPSYRDPLHFYPHGSTVGQGCATTAGTFYDPPVANLPNSYNGKYFFADFCGDWINVLDPATNTVTNFGTGFLPWITDFEVGADGGLYYVTFRDENFDNGSGGIYRIDFTGSQAPYVGQQPVNKTASAGTSASFAIRASGDPALGFQWQKDGVDIPGATEESYTTPLLTLSDNNSQYRCVVTNAFGSATSNAAILTVSPNTPPVPTILTPTEGTLYSGGETFSYSGSATDTEDGNLPASAYTWQIDFHHDTHTHPFLSPTSGVTGGTFTIPTSGETSDNVWYRIHLTVKDSKGATVSVSRDITPRKSTVTLQSNPPGLQVTLDGVARTTPYTYTGVVGINRTLGATSPQNVNGTNYAFSSWSDGGGDIHTISQPSADATITANYAPVTAYTAAYTVTPPSVWHTGRPQTYSITIKNIGLQPWNATGANSVRLGIHFGTDSDVLLDGWATNQRFSLPSDVPVGGSVTMNVTVTPPTAPGEFILRHRMVKEGVTWFNQIRKTPVTVHLNNAAFVSQTIPTTMFAGQTYNASVTMQNTGTTTWQPGVYFLGSSNPQDNTTWGKTRVWLTSAVAPGANMTVNFTVTAPATKGDYNIRWRMIHEGIQWFGDTTQNLVVKVRTNGAAFVSQNVPSLMMGGRLYNVSVTMQNSGVSTWQPGSYSLGSQNPQDNQTWAIGRVFLTSSVPPGSNVTFNFAARAPSTANTYNFQWRMVQEGVEWFGDLTPNVPVRVQLNDAAFVSQSLPTGPLTTGQTYSASVTMQNTGSTTWQRGVYFLGSQNAQDNMNWGMSRVWIPSAVAPGAQVTIPLSIKAPSTAGTYNFQWRMIQEGVQWFGATTANVAFSVQPPAALQLTSPKSATTLKK